MGKLQFRRGPKSQMPSLADGEPGFANDTGELFIGSSTGNFQMTKKSDIGELGNLTTTAKTNLVSAINENVTQLAQIASDDTFENNSFVSNLTSYIGVVNTGYLTDNGTRFYILPKAAVTTGLGGAIKIFADPYQNGTVDYRDFGLYFHANQNGDTGANGTGVNWINSKVNGIYSGQAPDIGFSFQDGAFVAGRFAYLVNGGGQAHTCFIVGSGAAEYLNLDDTVKAEIHGNMGFSNGNRIRWKNNAGTGFLDVYGDNATDTVKTSSPSTGGFSAFVGGIEKLAVKNVGINVNTAIIQNTYTATANNVSFDLTGYNRVKLAQTAATTITWFNGNNGQRLTILFSNNLTTIQHNASVKLKGGVDYTGNANETLVLEMFDGVWQEISRSANHV